MTFSFKIQSTPYFFDGESMEIFVDKKPIIDGLRKEVVFEPATLNKLTFFVTNKCNGRCKYCYETHGTLSMNYEAADFAISYLVKHYKHIVNISFFGGEPLINFDTIKYIVEKLNDTIIVDKYSIVTNAVLLDDDMLKFMANNDFSITISLDGPAPIHDALRSGCLHEQVIKAVKMIQATEIRDNLDFNCTYTKYHADNITSANLNQYFQNNHYIYQVSDVLTDIDWLKLPDYDIEHTKVSIDQSLADLCYPSLNRGVNGYLAAIIHALVTQNYCEYFCDELCSGMAFDINGNISPCSKLIGKVTYGDPIVEESNKKSSQICLDCWARGLCCHCSAEMILDKNSTPHIKTKCNKKDLYEYALVKLMSHYHADPEVFNNIIENFDTSNDCV